MEEGEEEWKRRRGVVQVVSGAVVVDEELLQLLLVGEGVLVLADLVDEELGHGLRGLDRVGEVRNVV